MFNDPMFLKMLMTLIFMLALLYLIIENMRLYEGKIPKLVMITAVAFAAELLLLAYRFANWMTR